MKRQQEDGRSSILQSVPKLLVELREQLTSMLNEAEADRKSILDHALLLNMQRAIDELVRKCGEKRMSIGVMGESNSGKSTFLNAFTGTRILRENILEDAHAVPISLESSDKESVPVLFTRGDSKELTNIDNIGQILHSISEYNTLQTISCHAPFPEIPTGLRLWDLPAIDSMRTEAQSSTRELALCCELLLITTPIYRPLPMNLLRELKRNYKIKPIIFVGTCADLLNQSEHEQMRNFFALRIKKEFGKNFPFYLVSALSAWEKNTRAGSSDNDFSRLRQKLLQIFFTQNQSLIHANCAQSATRILLKFLEYLRDVRAEVVEKRSIISAQLHTHVYCADNIERQKLLFQDRVFLLLRNMRDICFSEIDNTSSDKELSQFINAGLPACLEIFKDNFANSLEKGIRDNLSKGIDNALYASIRVPVEKYSARQIKNILLKDGELDHLLQQLQAAEKSGNQEKTFRIGGSALAGYALAALMPGIGWLGAGLAALTGTFLGASFTNGMNRKKQMYEEFIKSCFDLLITRLKKEYGLLFINIMEQQREYFELSINEKKCALSADLDFLDANISLFEEYRSSLNNASESLLSLIGDENG